MENLPKIETFWRAAHPEIDITRSAKGNPIMSGVLAPFNSWTEINSPIEGHFMERLAPTAFRKTISDRLDRIRVLFQHGREQPQGEKPLGRIIDLPADETAQRFNVELFNVSYVNDLMPAIEQGQYGVSFAARDIRSSENFQPEPSTLNPHGLPEVTREEMMLREFGPVTFPAYDGTSVTLRSITEDFIQPGLRELLAALGVEVPVQRAAALPDEEAAKDGTSPSSEPQHSAEPDNNEEERPSWQLRA